MEKEMKSYSQEEFNRMVSDNELEVFTADQLQLFAKEADAEILKSEGSREEIMKAVADEIRTFTPSKVWGLDTKNQLQSNIVFTRPQQVEWEPVEGDEIQKSRGGIYKDTPENRKLGRVGKKFGGNSEVKDQKAPKSEEEQPKGEEKREESEDLEDKLDRELDKLDEEKDRARKAYESSNNDKGAHEAYIKAINDYQKVEDELYKLRHPKKEKQTPMEKLAGSNFEGTDDEIFDLVKRARDKGISDGKIESYLFNKFGNADKEDISNWLSKD